MNPIKEPIDLQLEFANHYPSVILASSSPNRKALLEHGGVKVTVYVPDIDESPRFEIPDEAVMDIAKRKLIAYLESKYFNPMMPAISADTMVLIGDELLGKPQDEADARAMLAAESGKIQTVITGSGLYIPNMDPIFFFDKAQVVFKSLTYNEIEDYILTGEPIGAAGAYRIQRTGYNLVDKIIGDWTTVVGLPLGKLIEYKKNLS